MNYQRYRYRDLELQPSVTDEFSDGRRELLSGQLNAAAVHRFSDREAVRHPIDIGDSGALREGDRAVVELPLRIAAAGGFGDV